MKKIPIQIVNIETKEITTYPSITAYSKVIGLSRERIETYLDGRTTIEESEHNELCELCFKSRNWDHVRDHARKIKT